MNDHIYVSSGVFGSTSLDTILSTCTRHRFLNVELSSGLQWSENILQVMNAGRDKGLRYLLHNYFPPPKIPFVLNLGSLDRGILQNSREHCFRALEICDEFQIPFFSVHSGFAFAASPEQLGQQLTGLNQYPYQKSLEAFVESLIIVCDHAKKNGVELLIENNVVARKNLVNGENKLLLGATAEDLLEILSSVGSRSLGLLIDTGHLKVTANAMSFDPLGFLDDLRQHIRAFHLSENDGTEDQNSAVGKHSWFLPIVKSFRDALFVLEAYNLTVQETRDSISLLEVAI